MILLFLYTIVVQAQISIGGNVYGGGNHANVGGNTDVTVTAGTLNKVFGGARMANVGGRSFVNIDGHHASDDIIIADVYGGNDVAGTIGKGEHADTTTVPAVLENILPAISDEAVTASGKTRQEYIKATYPKKNAIDNSWKTFVATSRSWKTVTTGEVGSEKTDTVENKWIAIGSMFGGGNGDFVYTDDEGNPLKNDAGKFIVNEIKKTTSGTETITIAVSDSAFTLPDIDKTYLEIKGGNIAHVYGGGNKATINKNTTINIDNESETCDGYVAKTATALWTADEGKTGAIGDLVTTGDHSWRNYYLSVINDLKKMSRLQTFQSNITSFAFNHARVFGGNNQAPMAIRPTWNLQQGNIRDLYSGGNKGNMTSPEGLLLEIDPAPKNTSSPHVHDPEQNDKELIVENVFGGCRMADVEPLVNGVYTPTSNLSGYSFPNELSARLLVRGGNINNVYGGNDITGTVFGGNAVGIYTTIRGDVYGGGNGAYAYTNYELFEDHDVYGDFYYSDSLNAHRPNAEQVSIRLKGTDERHPTIIKGAVYVGGNCASMATKKKNPLVELKIGNHVIADKVFLGNNGEKMVDSLILKLYASEVDNYGNIVEPGSGSQYNSLKLKDKSVFASYMEGVTMNLQPDIVFDSEANGDPENYDDNTSYIGSFYCGGNVGSMAIPGKNSYKVTRGLNIFEKFVGGCNSADVAEGPYNAAYEGGVLGATDERGAVYNEFFTDTKAKDGNIKTRLEINLANLTITPLRWNEDKTRLIWNTNRWYDYTPIEKDSVLAAGSVYYTYNSTTEEYEKDTVAVGETVTADGTTQFEEYFDFVPVNNSEVNNLVEVEEGTTLVEGDIYYTSAEGAGRFPASGTEKADDTNHYWEKDHSIRLLGGNIYGGCYNSGHVNGNVVININEDVLKRDETFGERSDDPEHASDRYPSGVRLIDQRDDLDAVALILFGGGCGEETEIWGSTTVNHKDGYVFQICGGGEKGIVGKKSTDLNGVPLTDDEGNYVYEFDPRYSSTVNLMGSTAPSSATSMEEGLPESEYLYGGGKEGIVCGNTYVYLGNGRIYDAFAGASEADILGHTEAYIGRQPNGSGGYKDAFPWIADIVYGGNDFSGTIWGEYEEGYDFTKRVRNYATDKDLLHGKPTADNPGVLKSATYVEYLQGRVDTIFGGNYAYYNYRSGEYAGCSMPYLGSSFVNIRPNINGNDSIKCVFGAGTGYPKNRAGDKSQDRSYVLIDIPKDNQGKEVDNFKYMKVFGAGSYNGLGMRFDKAKTFADSFDPDSLSAIIDLLRGKIKAVYGGSYNEGVTARTVVNVPSTSTLASTIIIDSIFGGAFGTQILPPCDVYESNVNYRSGDATVNGAVYGGNNNERRTLYSKVNVSSPIWSNKSKGYTAPVYGAGHGIDTWSEYTEVNLEKGAYVYEVYGGGEMGHVLNAESVQKYMQLYKSVPSHQISVQDPKWKQDKYWNLDSKGNKTTLKSGTLDGETKSIADQWAEEWADAWTLGDYYEPKPDTEDLDDDGITTEYNYLDYAANEWTNLTNTALVTHDADMDDRDYSAYAYADGDDAAAKKAKDDAKKRVFKRYNANVRIHEGATVTGYAYGGGLGADSVALSGDVYGTTYIALLGGTVVKDIYAAGTTGAVYDLFHVDPYDASTNTVGFTASANAYVKGGSCRNVYGGGWKGDVGHHDGDINATHVGDVLGETHVVIGDAAGGTFASGLPTVQRNAYGGGEGGAVYGTAHLTLYNGYVGYQYNNTTKKYEEKIEDDTKTTPNTFLQDAGCIFGGGYIDNSYVDKTSVHLYDGYVRGSVFGGGEIAAIGRGRINKTTSGGRTILALDSIFRPGKTNIEMYGAHIGRNVYGGGRGSDNLGGHGNLNSDGYVFGQTEVHIHGGEVGTVSGVSDGNGNVYGGSDEGLVYSAYENTDGSFGRGVKPAGSQRYKDDYQGYYYKHKWYGDTSTGSNIDSEGFYTEDVTVGSTTTKERMLTEDCKVLVEPRLKVLTAVNINDSAYKAGQYVTINDLNTMGNKNSDYRWQYLDSAGIIIHNAVFAGGNTVPGSSATSANTTTVFGNATASIHDIYHRDMITLGTRHTGGLYGDGNLTLVDGYRELNITNYGTDYYSIAKQIGIDAYHALPKREADYYELRYTCLIQCKDKDSTLYKPATTDANGFTTKASTITADEMQSLFVEEKDGKKVSVLAANGDSILALDKETGEWIPNPRLASPYWKESGVLPVYAGRLMNSIQRADLCGVWGSRMVMQGAQDRVPEEVDYTNYTINRVREVSLNKKKFKESDPETTTDFHGNYFGIYNIVNYLGALTSDVDFGDESSGSIRTTDNSDAATYKCAAGDKAYEEATFYDWKKAFQGERKRNNGNSHNKVALASGVYLELTTEESTGDGLYEKVWGPVTGVIELDLINVSPGIGGGFVYAKNQHGVREKMTRKNTTLTALNEGAVTQWDYDYATTDESKLTFETSGNFVHSTQTIIDDCYNVSNRYKGAVNEDGTGAMPAHYWYIKGSTYVYDQYISAFTGVPNAYRETVDIPLTIAAASHGKMKLLNVMPNRYAYYSAPGVKLEEGKKVIINDKTYYLNDPISYWDWYLLSKSEKDLFIEKTYVNCITCKIDGTEYKAGTKVLTDTEYKALTGTSHTYTDLEGNTILNADKEAANDFYIFRESNNVSHDTGYILTYDVNNPAKWDNWFTPRDDTNGDKIMLEAYDALGPVTSGSTLGKDAYYDGPTYSLIGNKGMLLGQRLYKVGELIDNSIYTTYQNIPSGAIPADPDPTAEDYEQKRQATFEAAYIVPSTITVTEVSGAEHHYYEGAAVPKSFAEEQRIDSENNIAYISTNTLQVTKEELIYKDSRMSKKDRDDYISDVKGKMNTLYPSSAEMTLDAIKALPTTESFTAENRKNLITLATLRNDLYTYLVPAYYCSVSGLYGGNYYQAGQNYRGLEAWSSLPSTDHDKFTFNYDALDLLIDPNYTTNKTGAYSEGQKYQYDGEYYNEEDGKWYFFDSEDKAKTNPAGYSVTQSVDYTASYNGTELKLGKGNLVPITRNGSVVNDSIIKKDDELSREVYEDSLVNEQRHYAPIAVTTNGTYYVVNTPFQIGSIPYAAGETMSSDTYMSLPSEEQKYVTQLKFEGLENTSETKTFYYCRDAYKIGKGGASVTNASGVTAKYYNGTSDVDCTQTGSYGANTTVPVGLVIAKTTYESLNNQQRNFTIHGISPTETSTLFVSRESDIYDLSKEKIITVIYEYDYDETDGSGNVTPISERHVVNIHLTFKSGVPTVADISSPDIILPGDFIDLREPTVSSGAYEVTGGGWELFESQTDAESHSNGIDYTPGEDPLYWYQDGYYVAYYAKSYAGRTYSNYVPVSVANYHDIADVMADKDHHMYIDNKNVKRDSKIYINNYGSSQNGLDLFKNLYDLSVLSGPAAEGSPLYGHHTLDNRVKAGDHLEFFLRTDIDHSAAWTPIGTDDQCFKGIFHGDGHTISGLNNSLFKNLCGEVYNLGVRGTFNTAGVVDKGSGYVENAWVKTSATTPLGTKPYAVFGSPSDTKGYQLVNSYYCIDNNGLYNNSTNETTGITTSGGARGTARAMKAEEFYNGTVAYDLNNFYLHKRYSDKMVSSGHEYKYLLPDLTDSEGNLIPQTGHYSEKEDLCSSGYTYTPEGKTESVMLTYVEDRFADGDFRFAVGNTSGVDDERHWTETVTTGTTTKVEDRWSPIWPDDYLFFGQKLTYGWDTHAHQEVPTAVVRSGGRLSDEDNANRVYRAPAYYGTKAMGVAHFNPKAYLAQTKNGDAATKAYPGMTAIDFAGHENSNEVNGTYKPGAFSVTSGSAAGTTQFYPPLLDDDGLTDIRNCDETKNLLVYAPATASADGGYANATTHDVLAGYFIDPAFEDYYDNSDNYRIVNESEAVIYGHLVQGNLKATNDHLLVDKQDFNAPIAYSFDSSHRMWYQRKPANNEYVDRTTGWQGISIPFTAELVTTHQKGEITHFYQGHTTGHEYWLRELSDIKPDDAVYKANFIYPSATGTDKNYTNHFLWDYYYKNTPIHDQKDKNNDTYLEYNQKYYKENHTHQNYPLLAGATPYILGLPGKTYYEFDLSGNFEAKNTAADNDVDRSIAKLDKQIITFASNTGISIDVSDNEILRATDANKKNGFAFVPTYSKQTFDVGTDAWTLNTTGNSYDKVPTEGEDVTTVEAFRPYFTAVTSSARADTRSIVFTNNANEGDLQPKDNSNKPGTITVSTQRHKILVTSSLEFTTNVRIVNTNGITLNTFDLEPGETVETRVNLAGVYMVQTTDGKFIRKIVVR